MERADLSGLRVVITREAESGAAFANRLGELGAQPIICPAIEIDFRNPPGFDEALRENERFDWVIFSSANAVRAVAGRSRELGVDPAGILSRTRVAAVGQSTAESLLELGVAVDLVPDEQSGLALAAALIERGVEGSLILFPASRIARSELPNALRQAGVGVVQLAVYETLAPADLPEECRSALERGEADILTFFSPSAARNLLSLAGAEVVRTYPVICLGETTAEALRECGVAAPIVADVASTDGIFDALLKFQRGASRAS